MNHRFRKTASEPATKVKTTEDIASTSDKSPRVETADKCGAAAADVDNDPKKPIVSNTYQIRV